MNVNIINNIQSLYNTYRVFSQSSRFENMMHIIHFASGFMGIHGLLASYGSTGRDVSKTYEQLSIFHQKTFKIVDTMLSMSMILNAIQSTPAILDWSWDIKTDISAIPGSFIFGAESAKINGTIASLVFVLKLPSLLKFAYTTYNRYISVPDQTKPDQRPNWSHLNSRDWINTATAAKEAFDKVIRTPTK